MLSNKHSVLVLLLALTAIVVCSLATLQTNQAGNGQPKYSGSLGSAEEAFDVASRVIQEYVATLETGSIRIDPHFRALLHSQSKLWTIRGYASCASNESKAYRWTVILNYHGMQDWEVLAKIVTPESSGPNGDQIDGISQAQGTLIESAGTPYENFRRVN